MSKQKMITLAGTGFVLGALAVSWCGNLGHAANLSTGPAAPTAIAPGDPGDLGIFVRLARRAVPSVVNISTLSTLKTGYAGDPRDFFQQFFGPQFSPRLSPSAPPRAAALGTGFVVDPSGIILTNNHVVAGADEITVQFTENPDEKPTTAKVIGRDPELDIALIQVKTDRKLEALPLGDSDALEVGEYVMAVGNPFGNGHSITHGIVSAKGRNAGGASLSSWLQIDAPINPGNSGGPLLNMKGEVVGVNNAIDARAQGIGFAIPVNSIKLVLSQLEKNGKVRRGYIGAVIGALTPEIADKIAAPTDLRAPFVTQVSPGGPAEKAGLEPYDVIVAVGSAPVHSPEELVQAIASAGADHSVELTIRRSGKERKLSIRTEVRPNGDVAAREGAPQEDAKPAPSGLSLEKAPDGRGVMIAGVEPGSSAEAAGLQPGDEILEVDRKPVRSGEEFGRQVKEGRSYLLRVKRSDPTGRDNYAVVILDNKRSASG